MAVNSQRIQMQDLYIKRLYGKMGRMARWSNS